MIEASVLRSIELVGSSKIKIGAFFRNARASDALPFASREGRTAFADDSLITIGKSHDKIVSVGCLRSFDDVVLSGVGGRVGDVVGDSPRKQYWVLRNQAELAPQIRQFVFANINTI